MKKTIVLFLVLISLLILTIRFSSKVIEVLFGIKPVSGISVLSVPEQALVFIDGNEVGKTPYENKQMDAKEYLIKLEKDGLGWRGKVKLNAGTLTVINRELSSEIATSAGEILTLEKGRGITAISNPNNAEVEIDGKIYGYSPLTVDLESGEHTIVFKHPNYLQRSIRSSLPKDYNLTISVDLGLSETDLTTVATPVITQTPELIVKDTPTNFLRVRDKPSTAGKEIARVNPKDTLILLEESGSWVRIRLPDGTEGYVSAAYVEKKK